MKNKVFLLALLFALVLVCSCSSCGMASKTNGHKVNYNGDPTSSPEDFELPEFPWPPKASAFLSIPPPFVKNTQGETSLRDVGNRLQAAFNSGGYAQTSYYRVPDGFALTSRLEQFKADGTPVADPYRWSLNVVPPKIFSTDYWRALISGQPGRYRVIVFVVAPNPFAQTGKKIDSARAARLAIEGATALPQSVGDQPFTELHSCIALVYEFEKPSAEAETEFKENSSLMADVHLQRILPYLRRE
jgi:hypothetical protein